MKISIITAVYNRQDTIGQTITSVRDQNYPSVEHVIQDGASEDLTLEIIKKTAKNVSLVSDRDTGIYDGINKGILRATGDVIGLMHSDDFFADSSVLTRIANLFEDSTVDGVYADLEYVSANEPTKIIRRWVAGEFKPELLARGWMPPHPTLYLRRSVFEKHGMYDTNYRIAADYDAMLRFLTSGIRVAYDPNVAVRMRIGGESNSSIKKIIRKSVEDYKAIRRHDVGGLVTLFHKNASKLKQFIVKN